MQLDILARQYIQLQDAHVDEAPAEISSLHSWLDSLFVNDARSALASESPLSSDEGLPSPLEAHLSTGEE